MSTLQKVNHRHILIGIILGFLLIQPALARNPELTPRLAETVKPPVSQPGDPALVARYINASFDFESGAQGWTSEDWNGGLIQEPAFHVDDFGGLNGGEFGRLTPITGAKSLWCGVHDDIYSGGSGYGHYWKQVFQSLVFQPVGDVHLSYSIKYDTEPVYDTLSVRYLDASGEWVELTSYSGLSDGVIQENLVIPAVDLGSETRIEFYFNSDGGYNDEDHLHPTDGAAIIDDLTLTYDGYGFTEDFEGENVGDTVTSNGFWTGLRLGRMGDYAVLHQGGDVLQEDPYYQNDTMIWGFFDDPAVTNYACGGHPEQGAVPYANEEGICLFNAIISPPISLTQDVNQVPIPVEASGTRIQFDVFMNLPIEELVFYSWEVRSEVGGIWTPWESENFVYYGDENSWLTRAHDVTQFVPPEATSIQVALVCQDLYYVWGSDAWPGDCHTQAPLFDNVQVERYDPEGPTWSSVDRFADGFQVYPFLHGAENARVVFDGNFHGRLDALSLEVTPSYPASALQLDTDNEPAVYAYVSVTNGDLDSDPFNRTGLDLQSEDPLSETEPEASYPYLDTVNAGGRDWFRYRVRKDPDFPDRFSFDLSDFIGGGVIDPEAATWKQGDQVSYFFSAQDDLGRISYFSHELLETTDSVDEAATSPGTFRYLPSWPLGDPDPCENRILLVEGSLVPATRNLYEIALTEAGWCFDRFDNPTNGGGLTHGFQAEIYGLPDGDAYGQALSGYKGIIYTGQVIEDVYYGQDISSDFGLLNNFLSSIQYIETGSYGFYLAGQNAASVWQSEEAQLLKSNFFDFERLSGNQGNLGLPMAPLVTSDMINSPVPYSLNLKSSSGYDVMSSAGEGMFFQPDSQHRALSSHTTINGFGNTITCVISSFGLGDVQTGNLTTHLGEVLENMTGVPFSSYDPVAVNLSTLPPGLPLNVDGEYIPTPSTVYWDPLSSHTISGEIYNADGGFNYVLTSWADGSNDLNRTIEVPAGATELDIGGNFIGAREVENIGIPLGSPASGAAWGDFDGDGFMDLYLVINDSPDLLLRNDGGGGFSDITAGPLGHGAGSSAAVWADYDNDGDQDLYLVTETDNYLYRNDGGGAFADVTSGPLADPGNGRAAAWADYDRDGDLDLYICNFYGANRFLRNDRESGFTDATSGFLGDTGSSVAGLWGDYDDDGYPDLLIINQGQPNRLLQNNGGGEFADVTSSPVAAGGNSQGAAWGDFDNDGDLDILLANGLNSSVLLENQGAGGFQDITDELNGALSNIIPIAPAWIDFDNDGVLDLYQTSMGGTSSLFLGRLGADGQRSFQQRVLVPLDMPAPNFEADTESAWADFNGDGYLDAFLSGNFGNESALLAENAGGQGNHWLRLDLVGTVSNRDALGARVELVTANGSQLRQKFTSNGDAQHGSTLHFGLGGATTVDRLEITWPCGNTEIYSDLAVDQRITITEGETWFTDMATGALADAGPGEGVAWGDFDGDGLLDIYLTRYRVPDALLHNNGDQTFDDVTPPALAVNINTVDADWVDYDNDGDPDLFVVNSGEICRLFRNDGGVFQEVTGTPLNTNGPNAGAAWADYDLDGILDVFIAKQGQKNKLFRGLGNDLFSDETPREFNDRNSTTSVAWGDVDGDGDPDLYLGNEGDPNQLALNLGGGDFQYTDIPPLGNAGVASSVAFVDYDGDGWLDLHLVNHGSADQLFHNECGNGGLAFASATAMAGPLGDTGPGTNAAWGDFDNDGHPDVFLVRDGAENLLLRNAGNGVFQDITPSNLLITGAGKGAAWADLDGDGDLDLYVVTAGLANNLFLNSAAGANHWLQVDLVGLTSNRSGLGATVGVNIGATTRYQTLGAGSGSGSQNMLRAQFGLGAASQVDQVLVTWPGGGTTALTGLPVDQVVEIFEGGDLGSVVIEVQPVTLEAPWQLSGPGGYFLAGQGSTVLNEMLPGDYTLTWGEVPGYTTPAPNPVNGTLQEGTLTFAASYASPLPTITSFADVPQDQGRNIRLIWDRSPFDMPNETLQVTGYNVYRRQDDSVGKTSGSEEGPGEKILKKGSDPDKLAGWDFLTYVPATGDDVYQYVVPTIRDGSEADPWWTVVFLRLLTDDPYTFYDTETVMAYSVDNLAPTLPKSLVVGGEDLLVWEDVPEAGEPVNDLDHYKVYAASGEDLADVELLGTTRVPEFDVSGVSAAYLVVSAVDRAGNESERAIVPNTGSGNMPRNFRLLAAVPNPFNPMTTIRYELPRSCQVSLRIYDLAGRLVNTLVQEEQTAGRYEIIWTGKDRSGRSVATGVYLYRLDTELFSDTRRMTLMK